MLDLHSHTTASDGVLGPSELVRLAASVGVRTLAVTDHDTIAGVAEAETAGRSLGVEVLCGIEISTTARGGEAVHVLGYLFRADDPQLQATLVRVNEARLDRNERIAGKLAALGMPVDLERIRALAAGGVVGRPHFARMLVIEGHVSSVDDAFRRWLGDGKPACVDHTALTPGEAVTALHRAGGVAVLAHPLSQGRGPDQALAAVRVAAELGFDGVEVYYRNHTPGEVKMLRSFAAQHGLVGTGGSDVHERPWPRAPALPPQTLDLLRARAERWASAS